MAILHLEKPRHGRPQAQLGRVGGVDPPHHRLGDAIERLLAEPSAHEVGQALIAACPVILARQHQIQGHARLGGPREEPAGHERPDAAGRQKQEPFGDGIHAAVAHDVGPPAGRVGADHLSGQADAPAEGDAGRLLGDEGVRTAFDDESVAAGGENVAAEARRRLVQMQFDGQAPFPGQLGEPVRGGQAGDAAPHDDDAFAGLRTHVAGRYSWTASIRAWT